MSSLPTSPGMATNKLSSNQPVFKSVSESGRTQSRITAGHLWEITCTWDTMLKEQFAPIMGFVTAQRANDFQISLPNLSEPLGVGSGSPVVSGAHSAGDSTITSTGWTASQTGIMKAGDILKFANHVKVYMVTADCDSDGSGDTTISIMPPLINALVDTESITVNGVEFNVILKDDITEYSAVAPSLSKFKLNMIESL